MTRRVPAYLVTRIAMCGPCQAAANVALIETIGAAWNNVKPLSVPLEVSPIPDGFRVKRYAAKVAMGARKPRMANRGDAPTTSHAANTTGRVCGQGQHQHVRNLAARGYR